MGGWGELGLATAAFYAAHLVPARAGLRAALVARLGRAGYGAGYGVLSVVLLGWMIVAAGRAPYVGLWDQVPWMRWGANGAMALAVLLAALGIGARNPLGLGGRAAGFDPDRPGIAGLTRHPVLWSLVLWSAAHLLVNGDLAHAVVFGGFLAFSVIGIAAMEARTRRALGADWARVTARTALVPGAALLAGRWRPAGAPPWGRIAGAGLVWAALIAAHPHVIGVSPLPW